MVTQGSIVRPSRRKVFTPIGEPIAVAGHPPTRPLTTAEQRIKWEAECKKALGECTAKITTELTAYVDGLRTSIDHAKAAGMELVKAQELVYELDGDGWISWLKSNVSISRETASKYMRLSKHWAEIMDAKKAANVSPTTHEPKWSDWTIDGLLALIAMKRPPRNRSSSSSSSTKQTPPNSPPPNTPQTRTGDATTLTGIKGTTGVIGGDKPHPTSPTQPEATNEGTGTHETAHAPSTDAPSVETVKVDQEEAEGRRQSEIDAMNCFRNDVRAVMRVLTAIKNDPMVCNEWDQRKEIYVQLSTLKSAISDAMPILWDGKN